MDVEFVLLQNKIETPITLDVYLDDTIDNIKNKLSRILNKDVNQYYLFHKKTKFINPYDIYNKLSLNNTKPIDKEIFMLQKNLFDLKMKKSTSQTIKPHLFAHAKRRLVHLKFKKSFLLKSKV